jgi:hypothetical protein
MVFAGYLIMTSLTISIENKDSYELATELVLALQESKAVVTPVSSQQTDDLRTTLDLPGLQRDVENRIMMEATNWANSKGLESIATMGTQDSDLYYLKIR